MDTWLDARLWRLEELMGQMHSARVRPEFDPEHFVQQARKSAVERISMAAALEQRQAENRQLRTEQEENAKMQRNRVALILMLYQLWESGEQLQTHKYPAHDLKDWEDRTSKLIEMAVGIQHRRDFLRPEFDYARWSNSVDEGDPQELIRISCLLERLLALIQQVNRHVPPPLQLEAHFDMQNYQD